MSTARRAERGPEAGQPRHQRDQPVDRRRALPAAIQNGSFSPGRQVEALGDLGHLGLRRLTARACASWMAATIRSSTTSRSSGTKSDGSIARRVSCALGRRRRLDEAGAGLAGHLDRVEAVLDVGHAALHLLRLLHDLGHVAKLSQTLEHSALLFEGIERIPVVVISSSPAAAPAPRPRGASARAAPSRISAPGKAASTACTIGCAAERAWRSPRAASRTSAIVAAAAGTDDGDAPAHAGPELQPLGQPRGKVGRRVRRRLELDAPGGVAHQPDAALDLDQQAHVAPGATSATTSSKVA